MQLQNFPLAPKSCIGILGGGQLGRMLSLAASRLGFQVHIYTDEHNSPAAQVSKFYTVAQYDNREALLKFRENVDIITFEFENIPVETLKILDESKPVFPSYSALKVTQDRYVEKTFLRNLDIPVAEFQNIETIESLEQALTLIKDGILKTRRFGYDGKGQVRVTSTESAANAWSNLNNAPSILEALIPFEAEFSVIAARSYTGEVTCYEPARNVHKNHILDTSTVPSNLPENMLQKAYEYTEKILRELQYVGIMGVEFFALSDGNSLVNELAPRVHNSGHWTMAACAVDQFENHIRAVCGWPLGSGQRHSDAIMQNLIGKDVENWQEWAKSDCSIHLYGKANVRENRKMGHIIELRKK